MKIAVSAMGNDLESPFSPVFGRCSVCIIVDTDTMSFQAVPNQAASASGGAGIQAAQDVANRSVTAVVTGNVGPNAYQVLASAGVPVYVFGGSTVRQAVEAFKAGRLSPLGAPTGPARAGMGMMRGMGMGRGMGGRGMGMGRGVAGQAGYGFGAGSPAQPSPQPPSPAANPSTETDDVASLKAEVAELRERLGKLSDRIDEKGGK